MELKDQVATVLQSKRLKQLGVPQTGQFWSNDMGDEIMASINPELIGMDKDWAAVANVSEPYKNWMIYSRFTASELGELLPAEIIKDDYTYSLEQQKFSNEWHVSYMAESETMSWELNDQCSISANEGEARAAMLIYLLENKFISPSQSTNQ